MWNKKWENINVDLLLEIERALRARSFTTRGVHATRSSGAGRWPILAYYSGRICIGLMFYL